MYLGTPLLSCVCVTQLSSAAEVAISNICWYTCDTIFRLWSSGFIGSLQYRIDDLQKRNELLRDFIKYLEEHQSVPVDNHTEIVCKHTEPETVVIEGAAVCSTPCTKNIKTSEGSLPSMVLTAPKS